MARHSNRDAVNPRLIELFISEHGARPVGVDLAARVFQVCEYKDGRLVNRQLTREEFTAMIIDPQGERMCMGIEACGACSYWSSLLTGAGHQCRIFQAAKVKSMLGMDKTDKVDAEGIFRFLLTFSRPVMAKSPAAVSVGSLITAREQLVKQQTQCQNAARAMLYELGAVTGRGRKQLLAAVDAFKPEDAAAPVYAAVSSAFKRSLDSLAEEIRQLTQAVNDFAKSDELCRLLMTVPGVGPITAVTLWPSLSAAESFKSARAYAAYAGAAPLVFGSGGEVHVGGVRRGNRSLKRVLFMAALVCYKSSIKNPDSRLSRAVSSGKKKPVMLSALANRIARAVWAVARYRQPFDAAKSPLLC